jgi:hypothetical protein
MYKTFKDYIIETRGKSRSQRLTDIVKSVEPSF